MARTSNTTGVSSGRKASSKAVSRNQPKNNSQFDGCTGSSSSSGDESSDHDEKKPNQKKSFIAAGADFNNEHNLEFGDDTPTDVSELPGDDPTSNAPQPNFFRSIYEGIHNGLMRSASKASDASRRVSKSEVLSNPEVPDAITRSRLTSKHSVYSQSKGSKRSVHSDDFNNNNNNNDDGGKFGGKMTGNVGGIDKFEQIRRNSKRGTGTTTATTTDNPLNAEMVDESFRPRYQSPDRTGSGSKRPHEEIPWLNDGGFFAFGQESPSIVALLVRRLLFLTLIGLMCYGGWMLFENQRMLAIQVEQYNAELAAYKKVIQLQSDMINQQEGQLEEAHQDVQEVENQDQNEPQKNDTTEPKWYKGYGSVMGAIQRKNEVRGKNGKNSENGNRLKVQEGTSVNHIYGKEGEDDSPNSDSPNSPQEDSPNADVVAESSRSSRSSANNKNSRGRQTNTNVNLLKTRGLRGSGGKTHGNRRSSSPASNRDGGQNLLKMRTSLLEVKAHEGSRGGSDENLTGESGGVEERGGSDHA